MKYAVIAVENLNRPHDQAKKIVRTGIVFHISRPKDTEQNLHQVLRVLQDFHRNKKRTLLNFLSLGFQKTLYKKQYKNVEIILKPP